MGVRLEVNIYHSFMHLLATLRGMFFLFQVKPKGLCHVRRLMGVKGRLYCSDIPHLFALQWVTLQVLRCPAVESALCLMFLQALRHTQNLGIPFKTLRQFLSCASSMSLILQALMLSPHIRICSKVPYALRCPSKCKCVSDLRHLSRVLQTRVTLNAFQLQHWIRLANCNRAMNQILDWGLV